MSLSTKRRARRAAAYLVSCFVLLVIPVASCSDHGITEPTSRLSPSGAAFSAAIALNTRVVYLGAPNSQPINFIRARVYDENGATIGSVDQSLDPTKSAFDFSLSVQLPGARATKSRMTLELANRGAGGEVVQYSGRIQSLPLAPGDFRQVDIDLYPGPLDNFDVRGVHIVKPIRDIVEGDSVVATAVVDGATANTRVIWSSLDAAIATIDNGGKIRGVSAGVARVVAAVGTLADTANVKVTPKRAGLIVTPDVLELGKVGDIGVYTATVIDRNGAPIANEPVIWSIADQAIGSFVSTATVQGMRVGQTTVTARAANDTSLRGTATFRVKPPQDARVARIDVSPASATLRSLGSIQTFVATVRDSAGNVIPNVVVSWSSGATSVATITQSGVATAVARGTTSIVATADGISGRASLDVVPAATDLRLAGGDAQTDTVGHSLALPFAVRTVDGAGVAVAGVPVQFTAIDGASVSVSNATSNSEGVAQTQVTLGHTTGAYHVSARAESVGGSPVTIMATATNGAPYALEIERAPSSPARNRVALTTQPIVRVVDIYGNRALHATPMITATVDSGTIDGNAVAATSATALATFGSLTLGGRVGDRLITFSSGSLRPATARVTLTAGAPASIVAASGATQIGQAGASVATVPSVRVVDVDGNPVAGATITFTITAGNGSIVNATATTDANGTASVGGWTLGATAGTNTLTASVGNLTTTFTATGTAGTPSTTGSTMNVSGTSITAGSATPITITIQLRDGNGNNLTASGGTVAIASTLGTVSTVVDNNNGSYTATLTAPQTTGTALITATLAAQSLSSSATVTIVPGAPSASTTTIAVGSTALSANGTTTITVTVRDAYGNIVTTVTPSSVALSSSIGTIGTVTCTNGVCTATYTAPASSGNASIGVSVGGTPVTSTPNIAVSAVASAVTGLTATRGNAQVSLSWTAPSSNGSAITDYLIEYKLTSGSVWASFSHSASTATTIAVTGLTNGTSYDFRVSAVNGVGTGSASSIATATPATTASAPTSLAATAGASQVALTWTAPNDGGSTTTDYTIEYSTDGVTWTTFAHTASTATSINVTGLTNGVAYRFRVSAVNAIGTSAPSSTANATPTLGGTPQLAVNGGNNQTATAGSAVSTAPSVKATDANNNPVQGVAVTFTVSSGGGSVTAGSANTDVNGIASVGSWTLGTVAGTNSLTATASGYTSSTINATGAVGAASAATSTVSASPTSLTANGSATATLTARLKDANGNNLTAGGASVTFATPSVGSIGSVTDNSDGTYTATYTAGTSAGNVTIQPKLGGTNFTNTATIGLTVGSATQLTLTTSASGAASGAAFTTQPVVQIRDASNNVVAGSTANVTMSVSANGVVVGTSTVAAINGVATFGNVGISGTAGTSYTLTFASSGLSSATQLITPTAGAAAKLAVITPAATAVNGSAFGTQPVIEIEDAFGNRTASTVTVSLGVSSGASTLGTTSVAAVNGRATFSDAGITGTAGTAYTLTYSATSLTSATQSITPTIGADNQLAITTSASGAASGAAFTTQPAIEIRDAQGVRTASSANVTMTVSTGGTVVGTSTIAALAGVATFSNVGISGLVSGSPFTLTFASSGLTSATQSIPLTAGAAAQLAIVTSAANATNGNAFATQPVIEVEDAQGNRTASTATVSVATSSGSTLGGTTSVAAVNGRASFTDVAISGTAGTSYTLTYTSTGLTQATQSITPTAGTATHLAITTSAAGSASGAAFTTQPVVQIRDASNNVVAGSTANVTMSVSANGVVVGTSTVAAINGVATFSNVGISGTAGTSYTLTFASSGLSSATQLITPTVGAAAKLAIVTAASGAVNGNAFTTQPVIEVEDAFGNRTASTTGVTLSVSSGASTVGTVTVAAVNGRATFSDVGVTGTAGTSYTLTYSATSLSSVTQSITPAVGADDRLAITTSAATAASGATFGTQPIVEIRDAHDTRTSSSANVTMTVSTGGTLVGTTTVAAVNGVATFTNAGISGLVSGSPYTLTFASSALTSATQSIALTAGAAAKLAIIASAASAVNGSAFATQPVIEIEDAVGNRTASTGSVTLAVSSGATTVGTVTASATSGRATFSNAGITGIAGTAYTLTYSSPGLTSATQSITPAVGADNQIAITTSAAGAASGAAFTTQPVVEIRDAQGSRTASTASVTMTVSSGGTVIGTATVAAVNGVATFSDAGISGLVSGSPYTLTFSATGLTGATQSIALVAGTASKLAVITPAATAASGAAFGTQPVIEIQDAAGNRTTSTATITMAVSSNATTVGTIAVAAVNGRATFTDAGISGTAGTAYTLTFSGTSLTSATQSITPSAGAPSASTSTLSIGSTTLVASGTTTITVTVKDAFGNVVTTAATGSIVLASDAGSLGAVSCTNGICTATFTAPGSSGTANISATIGGSNVQNSPTAVAIANVAGAPTGLSATSNQSAQVPLTWTAPASNGGSAITNYLVEYSANGGSTWSTFTHTASTGTSITVTGLTNGTTYTFRVSAINGVGTGSASGTATATPVGAPDAPTNLTAIPGSAQAALSWTAPANNGGSAITDYVIEYSSNGGTSWSTFSHTASTATSITVTGLSNGTVYTFRVSAKNANGTGAASTTAAATPGAPGAPTALGVALNQVSATSHTAALSWTAPASNGGSAITDYAIEYKPTSGSTWTVVSHTAQTTTTYSLTGLANSTSYDFRVSAKNAVGTGPYSAIASGTTTGPSQRLQCQTNGNSNSNSTSATVLPCGGVAAGDIIVIPVAITNGGTSKTITSADGFTALSSVQNNQDSQNQFQTTVFYKIATSADVGRATAYSFSWTGTEKSIITLVAYKNVDGSAPSMTSTTGLSATITAPSGPNMTAQSHTLLYFYLQNIALSSTAPTISEWGMTTGSSNGPSDLFKNTTAGANNANAIGVLTADIDKFATGTTSTVEKVTVTANSNSKAWTAIVLGIHP